VPDLEVPINIISLTILRKSYETCSSLLLLLLLLLLVVVVVLTAIGLTPGGSSTIHIYTQTVHKIQRTEHTQQ
jgi:hypothetical protein